MATMEEHAAQFMRDAQVAKLEDLMAQFVQGQTAFNAGMGERLSQLEALVRGIAGGGATATVATPTASAAKPAKAPKAEKPAPPRVEVPAGEVQAACETIADYRMLPKEARDGQYPSLAYQTAFRAVRSRLYPEHTGKFNHDQNSAANTAVNAMVNQIMRDRKAANVAGESSPETTAAPPKRTKRAKPAPEATPDPTANVAVANVAREEEAKATAAERAANRQRRIQDRAGTLLDAALISNPDNPQAHIDTTRLIGFDADAAAQVREIASARFADLVAAEAVSAAS